MDPILYVIRSIIGSPSLNEMLTYELYLFFEWLIAALLLLVCVSFVFKILYKLLTK